MSYSTYRGSDQFNVGRNYSGMNVTLKKIKKYNIRGAEKIYFIVGGGNISNYNLLIEDAIEFCEIENCKSKETNTKSVNQEDKYDKLLKLKNLLDKGIITQSEFDKEKEKILNY